MPLGSGAGAAHGEVSAGDAARVRVVRGDEVVLDGAPGAFTDAGLVDATLYVYEAVALDERGNASAPVAVAITTPDRTPPAAPSAIHGSGYPLVLSWNPDAGVTFTVSRDGVAFAVTAHAQLEDADAVDAVAPPAPVGLAIAGATDEAVTISWSASEDRGTAYAYGVGGTDEAGNAGPSSAVQSVEATSGTARYRVLVDGTQAAAVDTTSLELRGLDRRLRHRLMVLAVDAAGNVSPESAVLEVGDDLVPARPTASRPSRRRAARRLLSWSAVDGAEVYTVLRDGEEVGTTAETTFADAQLDADGSYRYTVRAAGPAGLPSPPSEPLDVVRDTVAPDASIVSSPQEITGASATLELTSDDPAAQLLCGIDGSRPLVPCETPWLLSHLADGEHAVEVGAVDAAGNEDATPASAAFETDGTPPAAPTLDVVVDESLAKGSLRGRVAITAVPGDGAVRVVVTSGDRTILDGDGGTVADEVMDDEELTYTAVSYDAAGNVSDVTTRRVRTPDRTPPAPPILTADGSTLPVALAWSGEDGATARIARDGGDPIVTRERALVDRDAVDAAAPLAPGGVVVTPTAGGATVTWDGAADRGTAHSYVARLVDADGNTSRPSAPADVIATSGIATYRVLLDGALAQTVTARTATVGGLAPGSAHRIAIVAVDAAGNAAQATAERAFTLPASVGTAPPVIATASATPGAVRPGVAVALAADVRAGGAPLADVAWTFSGGGSATGASAQHAWGAEGAQTATLRAADTAGGSATRAVQVLVDGTQPTLALAQAGAVLTVTAGDPLAGLASVVATDGGRPLALGAGGTATLAEGSHAIVATATDRAGNVATASRTVVVDRTAPTILVDAPVAVPGATAVVTVKLVDAGGGAVRLALDGRPASAGRLTVPAGRRALLVATDAAGNARQARADGAGREADRRAHGPRARRAAQGRAPLQRPPAGRRAPRAAPGDGAAARRARAAALDDRRRPHLRADAQEGRRRVPAGVPVQGPELRARDDRRRHEEGARRAALRAAARRARRLTRARRAGGHAAAGRRPRRGGERRQRTPGQRVASAATSAVRAAGAGRPPSRGSQTTPVVRPSARVSSSHSEAARVALDARLRDRVPRDQRALGAEDVLDARAAVDGLDAPELGAAGPPDEAVRSDPELVGHDAPGRGAGAPGEARGLAARERLEQRARVGRQAALSAHEPREEPAGRGRTGRQVRDLAGGGGRHGLTLAGRTSRRITPSGEPGSGPCRDRTYDLGIKSPLLYQLS